MLATQSPVQALQVCNGNPRTPSICVYSVSSSSSECSAQRLCKSKNLGWNVLPKAGLPPQTQEPRLQFYQGWIGEVVSRCCPHPNLYLASEQTLNMWKYPRGTNVEVRRVDLANWAHRTSPKFTTRVKYQFHRCVWSDQRSGNPNHPYDINDINFYFYITVKAFMKNL